MEEETSSLKFCYKKMVKIELPLFFNKDMNQSKTNLYCINQKHVHTQHQPNTNAHNASLFPCGFYSPRTFTPTSILPTPSFCAEPKGEVAESIIQKLTLSLLERGDLLPREKVFLCFLKMWILQLRASPACKMTSE